MKNKIKIIFISLMFVFSTFSALANVEVYVENEKFGLKEDDKIITEAKYSKLIKLEDKSFLFQYKNKYGIMSKDGTILVKPKYTQAHRYAGRFAVLGKNNRFGLYNADGTALLDDEYSLIQILYGKMFLIQKNYKYGLISFDGDIVLAPIADDIYMPKANTLKIKYDGVWYEIVQEDRVEFDLNNDVMNFDITDDNITVSKIIQNPIPSAGLGVVSTSDYFIKIFSSISPSYEQTIDELVLNNGADAVNILLKCSWLVKFPFVYTKNYINNFKTPNNGPLSEVKIILKNKINEK